MSYSVGFLGKRGDSTGCDELALSEPHALLSGSTGRGPAVLINVILQEGAAHGSDPATIIHFGI